MDHVGDLLTITQAAQSLGVSRPQVRRLINRGELAAFASVLNRRSVFIHKNDVEDLKSRALVALSPAMERQEQADRELAVA